MKLTHKLTLAFLFVSLIVIGLAAVFVSVTTSTQFAQYLVDQRQVEFVATVTDYYQAHHAWAGVDTTLRAKGLLPPFAQPGAKPPDPQPFALVNQNGEVIISGGAYQHGQQVSQEVLAKSIQIEVNGKAVGAVLATGQTPTPSAIDEKYLASVRQSLWIAALGGVAMALLLGLFLARTLTRPVRDLMAATRALAQGRIERQVPVRSTDELGELAAAFNQMSAELARATQSRKQMTADIAHDLRNPLMVIGGYLESLQDGKLKPTPERFATMRAEVQHLQRLVDDLRMLSLADAGELTLHRQPVVLLELLEGVAAAYQHQAEQLNIHLVVDVEPGLAEISLDPARMEQVLGNLVSNALRYTPAGGEIRLGARHDRDRVAVSVRDTGSGIAPDVLPHIFNRSYRGDPSRNGDESGLGLAIVKAIVELHGGEIDAESAGTGSEFSVRLLTS